MNEAMALLPAALAGLLLGAIFFGGLWWTVRQIVTSPRPALLFTGSLVLRTAVALVGFYIVGGEDWRRWLAVLLGFVAARFLVTRWSEQAPDNAKAGASHAS